jgi:hypothetical protein
MDLGSDSGSNKDYDTADENWLLGQDKSNELHVIENDSKTNSIASDEIPTQKRILRGGVASK